MDHGPIFKSLTCGIYTKVCHPKAVHLLYIFILQSAQNSLKQASSRSSNMQVLYYRYVNKWSALFLTQGS